MSLTETLCLSLFFISLVLTHLPWAIHQLAEAWLEMRRVQQHDELAEKERELYAERRER